MGRCRDYEETETENEKQSKEGKRSRERREKIQMSLTDSFIQNSILPPHRFSRNTQIYLSQKPKKKTPP